ncbi:MAG TPA: OsmC family peroxiredoxin [Casimicrobiaceae bacterium]|nr:OsmC family peroxiredoxin [Casimicrobiaceae bacterium]
MIRKRRCRTAKSSAARSNAAGRRCGGGRQEWIFGGVENEPSTCEPHARWVGSVKEWEGARSTSETARSGARIRASRASRTARAPIPKNCSARPHASCFALAMSLVLGGAGFEPEYIDATAHVTILPQHGGFRITNSHLVCEAAVPGVDAATFARHAEAAKAGCPVSQALGGTTITLDAKLVR